MQTIPYTKKQNILQQCCQRTEHRDIPFRSLWVISAAPIQRVQNNVYDFPVTLIKF